MTEKYGFVYIWRDRKHNRYYIGSHWGSVDDGYICSSKWMKHAIKRRPEDFKRRIIKTINSSRSDMYDIEEHFLLMIREEELRVKYYNLRRFAKHWASSNEYDKKKIEDKISEKTKAAMQRDDVRNNLIEGIKTRDNKSSNPEVREKRRQSMIKTMATKFPDRKVRPKFGSDEYRENMANKTKTRWADPEHRKSVGEKISRGLKGKKIRLGQKNSAEHCEKIKAGLKNYFDNKPKVDKNTPEYRANLKVIAKRYRDKKRAERIGITL